MPSPIGVADLAAGLPHAVSNSRRRLKERLCGRGINKQLKLGGSLNVEIAGLVTLEDSSENFIWAASSGGRRWCRSRRRRGDQAAEQARRINTPDT